MSYTEVKVKMTHKKFLLSNGQSQSGPFTMKEVLAKLESKEIHWMSCAFDQQIEEWITLRYHRDFAQKYLEGYGKPKVNPPLVKADPNPNPNERREWVLFRDENTLLFHTYLELIKMLQIKNLNEFDFLFHNLIKEWKLVADINDFRPEVIRAVHEKIANPQVNPRFKSFFERRQHKRAQFNSQLIVHNNKSVFKGESLEISAGGAGVLIDTQQLQTGQNVFLHFQSHLPKPKNSKASEQNQPIPAFNAICTIVSKVMSSMESSGKPKVRYGLKFTNISQIIKDHIKEYTEQQDYAA